MSWSKTDKKRVCAAIDCIAAKTNGGKAEMARILELESRSVLNNWRSRGTVPIDYHAKLIEMAKPELDLTPAMLHPDARKVINATAGATP